MKKVFDKVNFYYFIDFGTNIYIYMKERASQLMYKSTEHV